MTNLVLALYDIETANLGDGEWTPESFTYAIGIVRFVRYVRVGQRVHRAVLAENLHFGPVPLIDDILRPWVHAAVGYNAHQFDIPVMVANAVWDEPGFRALHAGGASVVGPYQTRPASPEEARAFAAVVDERAAHSRLIVPGTIGIGTRPNQVTQALIDKTFDPLAWLNYQTGHPHVCRLDWIREGTTLPEFQIDGKPVDEAAVPALWQAGRVWDVVAKCRADITAMEEMMHQALGGGRIFTNRMNTTLDGAPHGHADVFANPDPRGLWKYHIPTTDWWATLEAIAANTR